MRTAGQEPALDQVPHEESCQADKRQADRKEYSGGEFCGPECDQRLQDGPMYDIHAVREVTVFRKVSKASPESEDKDESRYPKDVKDVSCDPLIK